MHRTTNRTCLRQYHGATVQRASTQATPALQIIHSHPTLFAELARYPPGQAPVALQRKGCPEVGASAAAPRNPDRWQIWWWVCLAGQVVVVPFIFVMTRGWPNHAQQDLVTSQLATLPSHTLARQAPR
jgi:hypothetical protein